MSPRARSRWRKALLALMILILLFFAFELLFSRHRILHSIASGIYRHGRYGIPERVWNTLSDPEDGDDIPENSLARLKYKAGDTAAAREGFSAAITENEDNPANRYNRGNTHYRQDDLDAALDDYKAAMLADPKDKDAKKNYELVLMRKGYKPPKPKPEDKEGDAPQPEQNEPDKAEEKPQDEAEKQQYKSILDALDQKESRDRNRDAQPEFPERDKWW